VQAFDYEHYNNQSHAIMNESQYGLGNKETLGNNDEQFEKPSTFKHLIILV
jgi:hypothetical protein